MNNQRSVRQVSYAAMSTKGKRGNQRRRRQRRRAGNAMPLKRGTITNPAAAAIPGLGIGQSFVDVPINGLLIPNAELKTLFDRQSDFNRPHFYRMSSYTLKVSVPISTLREPPRVLVPKGLIPYSLYFTGGNYRTLSELIRLYPENFHYINPGQSKTITISVNKQEFINSKWLGQKIWPALTPSAIAGGATLAEERAYNLRNGLWRIAESNGNILTDNEGHARGIYPLILLDTTSCTRTSLSGNTVQPVNDVEIHVCDVQLMNATFATIET